jgi:hypothetical protein
MLRIDRTVSMDKVLLFLQAVASVVFLALPSSLVSPAEAISVRFPSGEGDLVCSGGDHVLINGISFEARILNDNQLTPAYGDWKITGFDSETGLSMYLYGPVMNATFKDLSTGFRLEGNEWQDMLCGTGQRGVNTPITISGTCGEDVTVEFSSSDKVKGKFRGDVICSE